jgi:hypothetical protein
VTAAVSAADSDDPADGLRPTRLAAGELLGQSTKAESPEAVSAGASLLLVWSGGPQMPTPAEVGGHRSLPAPSGMPARANDRAALSDVNLA